ncbi:MAG: hypothetical protein M5R38_16825 [Candidatus Methylomirabilis sp.]|nr:hypothetical protein [Candidatus Methylomirabilis sp.]
MGLVDHLGNLQDAIERAGALAGIRGNQQLSRSESVEISWSTCYAAV